MQGAAGGGNQLIQFWENGAIDKTITGVFVVVMGRDVAEELESGVHEFCVSLGRGGEVLKGSREKILFEEVVDLGRD